MKREAGFTLLEMLVALTVLALILAALAGGVRFAGGAFERGSAAAKEARDFDLAADLLRRQVGRAFPLAVDGKDGGRFVFLGEAGRVSFPVIDGPGDVGAGLKLAAFVVEPSEGGQKLVFRLYRLRPGATLEPEDTPLRSAVLLEGPWRMVFDYAGRDGWRPAWGEPRDLPGLVRLTVAGAGWPDIVARLVVDGDRGCLSANGGLCRERRVP